MDEPQTFRFSPEIEESTLGILWRNADRIPEFLKECDPRTHFLQVHCRHIFSAIESVYNQTGTVDWAAVVTGVKEMDQFEECGGSHGLDRIYSLGEGYAQNDQIFSYYIGLLKTYAAARADSPVLKSVSPVVGGEGKVFRVNQPSARDPMYRGTATVRGQQYQLSLNIAQEGDTMNMRFEPRTR